jgi:predicted secreted protein
MDWFGFAITYAVMWWMVLFMVLPMGINIPETRSKVEYASSPAKANIKHKLKLTSFFALIPTVLLQLALHLGWLDGVL